ncbi:hypothetical protein PF010_g8209 [Phytophthora fragariae]|uniref:RxLR effector protein n=1 Tax=Phytophthora fragariae TaxID=53985 RepID=A0A6G0LGF6_9STRA|nr:hypothetical protein PF010_g8209 [Phytophthora fragariae]
MKVDNSFRIIFFSIVALSYSRALPMKNLPIPGEDTGKIVLNCEVILSCDFFC